MRWMVVTLVVVMLAGWAWWQISQNRTGKIREELVLNVEDTSLIAAIKILDREGNLTSLHRDKGEWMVNGVKARKHAVDNLLATMKNQRVSSLVPQAALNNVVRDLGGNSVRIEVFAKNDESLLRFYVGGVTPDERGTFMIREGSEWPVIVSIPGFEGSLRSRYIMSERDWKSRKILHFVKDIRSITLEYPTRQEHSLKLEKRGSDYMVYQPFRPDAAATVVNRYVVEAYLELVNNLYAEAILDDSKMEVLPNATPFCHFLIEDASGQVQQLDFYPTTWVDQMEEADRSKGVERYYTLYNGHVLFLTQHLLMQKVFLGYEHFVSLEDFETGR